MVVVVGEADPPTIRTVAIGAMKCTEGLGVVGKKLRVGNIER